MELYRSWYKTIILYNGLYNRPNCDQRFISTVFVALKRMRRVRELSDVVSLVICVKEKIVRNRWKPVWDNPAFCETVFQTPWPYGSTSGCLKNGFVIPRSENLQSVHFPQSVFQRAWPYHPTSGILKNGFKMIRLKRNGQLNDRKPFFRTLDPTILRQRIWKTVLRKTGIMNFVLVKTNTEPNDERPGERSNRDRRGGERPKEGLARKIIPDGRSKTRLFDFSRYYRHICSVILFPRLYKICIMYNWI